MKFEFDIAIIGAGSAGLLVGQAAPKIGLRTALIERGRLGGDCLWTGCVPSKALLASAKAAHVMRHAGELGLPAAAPHIDTAQVWSRIRKIQDSIAATDDSPERYRSLGVDVVFGDAELVDAHTIRVGDRTLSARYILICTGSRPAVPPIEGLEDTGYLTSENLFELERAPASIVILGAGPIGVEIAQAMNRLGVQTTLLERADRILEREEPALSAMLHERLRYEGVDVRVACEVSRVTRRNGRPLLHASAGEKALEFCCDGVFIATGRLPNVESLGLERAGIATGKAGIIVDDTLRTSAKSVYAVGDCVGRFLFTHSAGSEATTAIRNMFYPGSSKAKKLIPWTTFSDPELAHVGLTADEARGHGGSRGVRTFTWDLQENDRARAESAPPGRIIAITDDKLRILGAHILAPAAGEMIGQFTLAIEKGVRLSPDLRDLVQVYPTFSTNIPQLAEDAIYAQLATPLYRALRRVSELLRI